MLLSLTLNSKALIIELTALAETYVDNAPEIVQLIEDRILKILPKYQLYSFYLLDSIIKNIGNPYNILFAKNLYKLFTGSYLIVEDTNTRQDLINLFQTWTVGKSSNGLEIFPAEVLLKIESFIIKATCLAGGSAQGTHKFNRDNILRESNYLLQYIIAMDDDLSCYQPQSSEIAEKVRDWRRLRNDLVFRINIVSEDTMTKAKDAFERLKERYAEELREIRQQLDDQATLQKELIRFSAEQMQADACRLGDGPELNNIYKQVDVLMILDPSEQDFVAAVEKWGVSKDSISKPVQIESPKLPEPTASEELISEKTELSLAESLGLNFDSIDFPEFNADSHPTKHGSFDECEDDDEDKGYNPERGGDMYEHEPVFIPKEPIKDFVITKSSLKRPNSAEERSIKRVRFES